MRKRLLSIVLTLALAAGLCPAAFVPPKTLAAGDEFRAVWVATVINLDYPSQTGLSAAALKREADSILNGALDMGFNAVILQVRPAGDALYQSSYFPWSDVLTGEQGKEPPGGFDPLAYFTEGAHSRGMELHAWVNPYRVARNVSSTEGLSAGNPAKKNPSWTVAHTDGHLYYNPGIPETLELILDGVREIAENYNVDGIHYDDYFYPGKTFDDDAAYKQYGAGFSSKEEWRRDNLNKLIKETQEIVHKARKNCRFGVAPQAIWANKANNPLGSETRGYETYYEQSADTRKWVTEGWVDYIAPQIYWEIGRENSDYAKVLAWWADLCSAASVDLYTGHATYLMNGNSTRPAWSGTGEIGRQLAENSKYSAVKGSVHFRYKLIAGDKAIAAAVKTLYSDAAVPVSPPIDVVMPAPASGKLIVGRPDKNVTYSGENYYITGASDPNQKLTVNGTEITNRTAKGYFSYYATLKKGTNTFTFTQGNTSVTRTITVPVSESKSEEPKKMAAATIEPGVFPDGRDEVRTPGATVTLSCVAPIGAEVTVRVGGQTLSMKPDTTKTPSGGGIYATTYKATYTYPNISVSGGSPALTVGTPVYTMTMGSTVVSRIAAGALKLSTKAARITATVSSDIAFVYPGPTTTGGPVGELAKGQTDAVVAQQNGTWIGLESGLWVLYSDVRLALRESKLQGRVAGTEYAKGEQWDTLTVKTDTHTAALAVWSGKSLTFTVYASDAAPAVSLPPDALIGKADASFSGGKAVYTLTPAAGMAIDGYYVEPVKEGLRLHIKHRPAAKAGDKPLDGFTLVIDAGHGGTETGAYGPLGADYAEKYVNLYAALKLRSVLTHMGAKVTLTRSSDATTTLQSRLEASRNLRPDLFLSLHCNSMSENVNSDTIRGVSVFYREAGQLPFSEHIYDYTRAAMGIGGKGVHKYNLYVLRGTWAPGGLIELGFLNNPFDYEWLADDGELNKYVTVIAEGIVDYFR
ncbi:MAG: family 10 glycosylhydrolase [Oscillospiraceae bacterium]|nr:family 10 glycosylhydrolase [Oscillospiraceae bacterium]